MANQNADAANDWRTMAWDSWARQWWSVLPAGARLENWRLNELDECLAEAWRVRADEDQAAASEQLMTAISSEPPPVPEGADIGDTQLIKLFETYGRGPYKPAELPFGAIYSDLAPRLQAAVATIAEKEVTRRALGLLSEVHASAASRRSHVRGELRLGSHPAPEDRWPERLKPLRAVYMWERINNQEPDSFWEALESDIRSLQSSTDDLEREALVARVRDAATAHLLAFADAIPWFLSQREPERDDLVAQLAQQAPVRAALEQFVAGSHGANSLRAEGLLRIVSAGRAGTASPRYRWYLDENLYSVPVALNAPSSTWLDDAVEVELRARIDGAIRRTATRAISEETEVTGALISNLVSAFDFSSLPAGARLTRPIKMSITSTNSRKHEKLSGADIGIVTVVERADRARVEAGHLVQVKHAENRKDEDQDPYWIIDREQLNKILNAEPTAAFWLLVPHEFRVAVVSAKYLLTCFKAASKSCTVRWDAIRSASVPLSNAVVDLLVGLWIGSPAAVAVASGEDSNHLPATMLRIHVGQGALDQ